MVDVELLEVHGTVQGVGFRPHVHRLATSLGIDGDVRNVDGHVVITASGAPVALATFRRMVRDHAPPHARISRMIVTALPGSTVPATGFIVRDSETSGTAGFRLLPPDLATCEPCLVELFDPADRRYRYPFVNCTDCGPRATIVGSLPYDRTRTSMRGFPLCAPCAGEYHNPGDRRFHAEPIACPDCGPRLRWSTSAATGEDALRAAVCAIAEGGLVALKGIGGYQLVCDADDDSAVRRLRTAKSRPRKAFAVMLSTVDQARELSEVDEEAAGLLLSVARPIVLLPRRGGARLAPSVAPDLPEVGLFLPCSPLHHLLLAGLDRALVVTSGNRSGEPLLISDDAAQTVLGPLVDGVLGHNRPILSRYDDSVAHVVAHRPAVLRRARGYAPQPLPLPTAAPEPVLALGAQLKHTTALAIGEHALVGPHTGDLENAEALAAFERTAAVLCELQRVDPAFCAHDLHPAYLSTQYAARWPRDHRIPVQHHHAHVAATAAEHGVRGRFIGVAYDGLGFGDDGTLWGGEILLATYRGYRRMGRIGTVALPGGVAAVRRPARTALGYLLGGAEDFGTSIPDGSAGELLDRVGKSEVDLVRHMVHRRLNSPLASSMGRLFDATAALLGLCDDNGYEGEAAVLLEAAARAHPEEKPLAWSLHRRGSLWVYDPVPTLRHALQTDEPAGVVAARFHSTVTEVTLALVGEVADQTGVHEVCLGGGVFQNRTLAESVIRGLDHAGFEVHTGERVPVNDGGISYGQAAIAAARLAGR